MDISPLNAPKWETDKPALEKLEMGLKILRNNKNNKPSFGGFGRLNK